MADDTADGEPDDVDDPAASDGRSWRPMTIVAAVIIVATVIGATFWFAGDDAFKLFDSSFVAEVP